MILTSFRTGMSRGGAGIVLTNGAVPENWEPFFLAEGFTQNVLVLESRRGSNAA